MPRRSRQPQMKALSPAALAMVAARFRILSDASRLSLLNALMEGELNVNELVSRTGLSQANASKHLTQLADAGFIARRRDGLFTFYSIEDPSVFELCDLMCGAIARKLGRDLREIA